MTKITQIGVCDHCGGAIAPSQWYTNKGKVRRYCSLECRNTANSRAGAWIRREKTLQRIKTGQWKNPFAVRPPTADEQAERARKGRLREVREGRWRNPATTEEAREKLSRPRKHAGILHAAIEKLRKGKMADLTPEEQEAYREYRRNLRQEKKQTD